MKFKDLIRNANDEELTRILAIRGFSSFTAGKEVINGFTDTNFKQKLNMYKTWLNCEVDEEDINFYFKEDTNEVEQEIIKSIKDCVNIEVL